jgi:formylglycine-generating enzyme required for sulfatase activity
MRIYTIVGFMTYILVAISPEAQSQTSRDCGACPEMVVVPAGSFTMGSPENEPDHSNDEGPLHEVHFRKPFAIGQHEVTYGEFLSFVNSTDRTMEPCFHEPGFPQTERHPAVCISWMDARQYAAWLSKSTGKLYRLPTEAEWEYAARAATRPGVNPSYHFGNSVESLCEYANSAEESCRDGYGTTAPVGSFKPNTFGLFDMHGNVWELVEDCPTADYRDSPNDGSALSGDRCDKRVIRGGGWVNKAGHLRAANRGWIGGPELRDVLTGFRVVKEIE